MTVSPIRYTPRPVVPVVVEAVQFTGDNGPDIEMWANGYVTAHPDPIEHDRLWDGAIIACDRDSVSLVNRRDPVTGDRDNSHDRDAGLDVYVVRYPDGHFELIDPEVFEATMVTVDNVCPDIAAYVHTTGGGGYAQRCALPAGHTERCTP